VIVKLTEDSLEGTPIGFTVWVLLEDTDKPQLVPESIVIGTGETKEQAVASAQITLADAGAQLEELAK
jgi:hypothetical protein